MSDYYKAKNLKPNHDTIKVIFTGGTIGSSATGDNISPDSGTKYLLLNKYSQRTGKDTKRFDIDTPMSILSENAVPNDVLKMAKAIRQAESEGVKGIIMTHGSDTLAYSSAYLGLLLADIKVPVVLVASNLILSNEKANGVDNFETAVNLIDSGVQPNVYVAYKNPEDNFTSIHLGTRMNEPAPMSDSFYSPEGLRFATYKDGKIIYENTSIPKSQTFKLLDKEFDAKYLSIHPQTGLNYDVYDVGKFDYVVHGLYHSGTANTRNEYPSHNSINFAMKCKENGKPFYLCNIKKKDVNYDSTNKMKKAGMNFMYGILPNVAEAKLNIAYSLLPSNLRDKYISTNINGENIEELEKENNYEIEMI